MNVAGSHVDPMWLQGKIMSLSSFLETQVVTCQGLLERGKGELLRRSGLFGSFLGRTLLCLRAEEV